MDKFRDSLKEIEDIIHKPVDIVDRLGYVHYSSSSERVGTVLTGENNFKDNPLKGGKHRFFLNIDGGSFKEINLVRLILKDITFENLMETPEQFFINILDGEDVSEITAKKFNIQMDKRYIVYSIGLMSKEHFNDVYSLVVSGFAEDNSVWVFPYEGYIVLVQVIDDFSDDYRFGPRTIKDMINSEAYIDILIGVGNIYDGVLNIKKSFSEGVEAIRIGTMFNLPQNIFVYRDIFLERIVSFIPEDKMEELLIEVFWESDNNVFDGEMVKTIDVLFKNNLNVSDSAKILYIHRNTLLYRIEKIQKVTGLDLRKFEDAVTFKLIFLLKQRRKI